MKKLVLEGTYALSVLGSIQRFRSFDRDPDDASGGGTRVVAAVSKQCAPSTYVRTPIWVSRFAHMRAYMLVTATLPRARAVARLAVPAVGTQTGRQGRKYCAT